MSFAHLFATIGAQTTAIAQRLPSLPTRINTAAPLPIFQSDRVLLAGGECQIAHDGDWFLLIDGQWRWADKNKLADSASLLQAIAEHGPRAWREVWGAFAAVAINTRTLAVHTAIDRTGQRALYVHRDGEQISISNRLSSLRQLALTPLQIDPQQLFHYCYFFMVPSPGTIYHHVQKLSPGSTVHGIGARLTMDNYFQAEFVAANAPLPTHAHQQLLDELRAAVCRTPNLTNSGAFLSGGLDSSTMAGLLAQAVPGARSFTIGFDEPNYDESAYAAITATHFGTQHQVIRLQPTDIAQALPALAAFADEPFGNSSVLPTYFCALAAKKAGVSQLIAGDGGDEVFAGNERYAKQQVFEHYARVPSLLRNLLLDWPLEYIPGLNTLPVARKAWSYVQQARIPLPDRLQSYNFTHRFGLQTMFTTSFLHNIDAQQPLQLLRERYQDCQADNATDRMLYLDWKFTLADNDLVKVNTACQLADMPVAYPMLDDALIEFSTHIPANEKLKNGKLRYFYREAMRGFLADETLSKKKHGFGLPFGVWLRSNEELKALAQRHLDALKERNIFLPSFIDEAQHQHQSGHASYYGELVWLMMMMNMWFEQNND